MNYIRAHILVESPFRIPLGGGGTDVDWYALQYGGSWGAVAIDLYCMILLSKREDDRVRVAAGDHAVFSNKTSDLPDGLALIREGLLHNNINHGIEISGQSDVSSRAGLGGSGALMTALLYGLKVYKGELAVVSREQLAQQAFQIEIDLGAPIGPQDQYAATFGGINWYERDTDGQVYIKPLEISNTSLCCLEEGLLLFDTGFRHSTKKILGEHKIQDGVIENLHKTKEIGLARKKALEKGNLDEFGRLLHVHWQNKLARSPNIASSQIAEWCEEGLKTGAVGGYLLGAGGGGHLLFWVNDNRKAKVREKMAQIGLRERLFRFDFVGTTMPYSSLR